MSYIKILTPTHQYLLIVLSAFISCQQPEGRIYVCVRVHVAIVTPEQCRDAFSLFKNQ